LHDSLGQSLLIIKNRAYTALADADDAEAVREQLSEISDSAAQAIEEVRGIAYDLRPYQLERFGLTKTLRGICQRAEQASGIVFETELDQLDGLFARASEVSLYRIVQEGINNIIKHSQATTAQLQIHRNGSTVHLTLRDNGCGFDPAAQGDATKPGGFGLIGLAERVRMLGGSYALESAPGAGATLHVFLPLNETS
jgi:signal transduction histidine kinase